MALDIRKVAVLGAGVMGSGIASHLAGAGLKVFLLDIVPKEPNEAEKAAGLTLESPEVRNRFSRAGVKNALAARPPAFYDPADAALIRCGNFEDHMDWIAEADWICEAVVEDLAIKTALFGRVAGSRRQGSIVSSNTSGIFVRDLVKGMPDEMQRRFFVTHFFNPVRLMRLLELVAGEKTDAALMEEFAGWAERALGKGIVKGKDTPNFVANRIGVYYLQSTTRHLLESDLGVEHVDAILGPAAGRPSSGVFRTMDLIGIDTHIHVTKNVYDGAPDDEERDIFLPHQVFLDMKERGWLGLKSKKTGFYKVEKKEGGGKDFLKLDVRQMKHVAQEKKRFGSVGKARGKESAADKVRALVSGDDEAAAFAWAVLRDTICYSAGRIPEIADDIVQVDNSLKWGWAWEIGPFETWDAIGVKEAAARIEKEGRQVPTLVREVLEKGEGTFYLWRDGKKHFWDTRTKSYAAVRRSPGVVVLRSFKDRGGVVHKTGSASLVDVGDGVLVLEFHSKMNTLDTDVGAAAEKAFELMDKGHAGLVVSNEDPRIFTAGANLMLVMMCIGQKDWKSLEGLARGLQGLNMKFKYCRRPVVSAPFGMCFGGGMEISLHCDAVQAHTELNMGLVETGVGIVPAGGGSKELALRMVAAAQDVLPGRLLAGLGHAFDCIATARFSASAREAFNLGYLRRGVDGITMNREHLMSDAKQRVLELAKGYIPPKPVTVKLPGEPGRVVIEQAAQEMQRQGMISEYDVVIASRIARILTGGDIPAFSEVTEQHLLDLEIEAFLALCGEQKTVDRISHTLTTGKQLRN